MGRAPCCDKNGLKKGPWTAEEDQKLIDYIQKHGHGSWRTLPKNAGLQRCGKSCRLRWTNYLRPDIKRGRFSFEEEETIIQLHSILGNKWSAIAARLPGRTDNEIKNYWNTHIRKRLLRMGIDPVTHSLRLNLLDLSSVINSSLYNSSQLNVSRLLGIQSFVNPELLRLATTLLSSSQRENPEFLLQDLHENQLNQFQSFQPNPLLQTPIHEIPTCTTSTTPYPSFLNETQLLQANVEQFPSNTQQNVWQDSEIPSNLTENFVSLPSYCNYYGSDHQTIVDNQHQNFSFPSVLSTPSSSPTHFNSSSTYIKSSSENERDSYCSNVLKFEIPDILDVNEFI